LPSVVETRKAAHAFAAREAGVYAGDEATEKFIKRLPGLRSWSGWHRSPPYLGNGHVHTIFAAKLRWTAAIEYKRHIISTDDGGSLALDIVDRIDAEQPRRDASGATYIVGDEFPNSDEPFLMLLSGLGGGSQDTYVRAQAAAAVERGWRVGVLNMRSCGASPVTSPRFFSARHGSVGDVRKATQWIRERIEPSHLCAIGWSNSGTIVCNVLADQANAPENAHLDAACCLAAPLDMPSSSANFERTFHRNVYDRAIGGSLAEKFRDAQNLFLDGNGQPKPVPAWRGGTFIADIAKASEAKTIRAVDEAVTAPCFGFPSVDAYYEDASADQRVKDVAVPLLILNAADDPIAQYTHKPGVFDLETLSANPNLVIGVTAKGGHLGWCDATDPRGAPGWAQTVALDFLDVACKTIEAGTKPFVENPF
jgi:predicted alpha/beta-fold hydrolase